jgi:hypothetical protein
VSLGDTKVMVVFQRNISKS